MLFGNGQSGHSCPPVTMIRQYAEQRRERLRLGLRVRVTERRGEQLRCDERKRGIELRCERRRSTEKLRAC